MAHKQEQSDLRHEYENRLGKTTTEFHDNTSKLMQQHSSGMASTLKKMDEKVRQPLSPSIAMLVICHS